MTSINPSLSVVIPLYNKARYIQRAAESVVTCFKDWPGELIIVDDGSTDGGREVAERMSREHSCVRTLSQSNQGVSAARNTGIFATSSEYVAFLDADDEWSPDFLSTILSLIEQFPCAVAYGTSYIIVDSSGAPRVPLFPGCTGSPRVLHDYFLASASGYSPICSSAVCIRRGAFFDAGYFVVGERHGEDKSLYGRLALTGAIAWSGKCGAVRNLGAANRSSSAAPSSAKWSLEDVLRRAAISCGTTHVGIREYLGFHLMLDGVRRLRAGQWWLGITAILRSLILSHFRVIFPVLRRVLVPSSRTLQPDEEYLLRRERRTG